MLTDLSTLTPLFSILCYPTKPRTDKPPVLVECLCSQWHPVFTSVNITSHTASSSSSSGFVSVFPPEWEPLEVKGWWLSPYHQGEHRMAGAEQTAGWMNKYISASFQFPRGGRAWSCHRKPCTVFIFLRERALDQGFSKWGPWTSGIHVNLDLLEMQFPRPHARRSEPEILEVEPTDLSFNKLSWWFSPLMLVKTGKPLLFTYTPVFRVQNKPMWSLICFLKDGSATPL